MKPEAMKTTTKPAMNADKNAARLEKARARLDAMQAEAEAIIAKPEPTAADRSRLIQLINVPLHEGGKIEGIFSIDSFVMCDFCQSMRKAAEKDPLIICGLCYAAADARYKEFVNRRHWLNMFILSSVLFTEEELKYLCIYGILCRFNEDGDTTGITMARNYIRIGHTHPDVRFGYWYKNAVSIAAALELEGITRREELPGNIRFGHSSLLIGFPAAALWFDDFIFTVYPDATTTAAAILAGAHACNGKKCKDCNYHCYTMERQPAPVQIAEVLNHVSKAKRDAILNAYTARKASAGK